MLEINELKKKLDIIKQQAFDCINKVSDLYKLQTIKAQYLGKTSAINIILKTVSDLPHQFRIEFGQITNKLKKEIDERITIKFNEIEKIIIDKKLKTAKIDVSLPGFDFSLGHQNPLLKTVDEIVTIFRNLGYQIISGNEVENEEFNFNRLNLPPHHPARDMHDTFYITNNKQEANRWLLRTHTTNVTARILSVRASSKEQQTSAVISLGNVYRKDDDDATHFHQFMQVDGFLVAPNITFANLKWTLNHICQQLFGLETKIRLRPSYFPFTEPSVEVDISCPMCIQGCTLCKNSSWIEVLGAGMIHPNVFQSAGFNNTTTGFAFGIGIERITMIKYAIDDIRLFYNNDIRFLKQF